MEAKFKVGERVNFVISDIKGVKIEVLEVLEVISRETHKVEFSQYLYKLNGNILAWEKQLFRENELLEKINDLMKKF